jgi:hypothetical protein
VHPHGRADVRDPGGRVGEPAVHVDVGLPPVPVVARLRDHVVVQRPQRVVRETLVVVLDLTGVQRDRHHPDALVFERLEFDVGSARPAHPGSVRRLHQRLERGDEASGRHPPAGCAVRQGDAVDG